MAEFTIEQAKEHAQPILERFKDGFQWTDILGLIPEVMQLVQGLGGMTGSEKEAAALMILDHIVDETDMPWVPDSLVDPIIKKGARTLIPLFVSVAKDKFNID